MLFNSLQHGIPELWILELEDGQQARIPGSPEWGMAPVWSPDGSYIAFQTYRDGNFEVYVMNADGAGVRRLTSDLAFDGRPSWGVVDR